MLMKGDVLPKIFLLDYYLIFEFLLSIKKYPSWVHVW
jgi:hypothetical protein